MACIARAVAHRGNAKRAANDLAGAESLLEVAQDLFESEGSGDPLVSAEIASLLASLRRDQRRFSEAESLLEQAAEIYTELEDTRETAEVLVKLSTVFSVMGEPRRALGAITQCLPMIDREKEPFLYLVAIHNQAHYLADLGELTACQELLFNHGELYQTLGNPALRIRLRWLLGRVEVRLGNYAPAEEALMAVQEYFRGEGLAYDAALVGLDLAQLFVEQRKPDRIHELVEEILPTFTSLGIRREAALTLRFSQEASAMQD